MKKRILPLLLALALCAGLLVVPAGAYDMGKVGERNIISIAVGNVYAGVIDAEGSLWMWGNNGSGQLGNGTTEDSPTPVKVMDNVAAVSCGHYSTAAIKADGSLWMWGSNYYGELGDGTAKDSLTPVKIMDNVAAVSCGNCFTAAIKADGSLWMWGVSDSGQLGNDRAGNYVYNKSTGSLAQTVPVKIMDNVAAVNCGNSHTAAIKTDGSLWMWGNNNYGAIFDAEKGNVSTSSGNNLQTVPVKVMDDVASVSCGYGFTAAVKKDGTLWAWGLNDSGQQFCDDVIDSKHRWKPQSQVLDQVAAVNCGHYHIAAIRTDGSLWTAGANRDGQLLHDNKKDSKVPTKVLEDVAAVRCGFNRTVVLLTDGTIVESDNKKGLDFSAVKVPKAVFTQLGGGVGGGTLWTGGDGKLQVPTNPTKEGFTFGGWYTDAALTIPWNFDSAVSGNVVLYAKWNVISSTAATTAQSTQKVSLNGTPVDIQGYTLKADNGGDVTYVKLRDIAALLDGTSAQFNVDWRNGAIYVDAGQAYTSKNGTELKAITVAGESYKWNTAPVLFSGETKALEGIVITDVENGGHTFFKLRDLGAVLGFQVDWSAEKGIYIETK